MFASYPGSNVDKILNAIAVAFGTRIFSEHEPQYWGFDSREQMDAFMEEAADQDREEFYFDVCAHVRGARSGIQLGRIGEIKAKIAMSLVETEPALLFPENKDQLLTKIREIYDRDHVVTVVDDVPF